MDIYHSYTIAFLHHSFAMSGGCLGRPAHVDSYHGADCRAAPVPRHNGSCIGRRVYDAGGCRRRAGAY